MKPDDSLTPNEVAELLNIDPRTVYNWLRATPPKLEGVKVGGRWFVKRSALEERFDSSMAGSPDEIFQIVAEYLGRTIVEGVPNICWYWRYHIRGRNQLFVRHDCPEGILSDQILLFTLLFVSRIRALESHRDELIELFGKQIDIDRIVDMHVHPEKGLPEGVFVKHDPASKYNEDFFRKFFRPAAYFQTFLLPALRSSEGIIDIDISELRRQAKDSLRGGTELPERFIDAITNGMGISPEIIEKVGQNG